MMDSPRVCDNCGRRLRPEARFCPECGRSLQAPEPPGTAAGPAWPDNTRTVTRFPAAPVAEPGPPPMRDRLPSRPSGAPQRGAEPWPVAELPGTRPPVRRPNQSRDLLLVLAGVVVLGVGTGVSLVLLGHHSSGSASGGQGSVSAGSASPAAALSSSAVAPSSPAAASSPVTSPSATLPSQQQAAEGVAGLLAQSGADRTAVTAAVADVESCANLNQDEAVFNNAASSRQSLLGKLAALPGGSALPASMLQDLTTAWQASGQADQDFAMWTQDEISQGCSTNYQSDPNFAAAAGPDDQATTSKEAFVAAWKGIATQYNLPVYQWNQI